MKYDVSVILATYNSPFSKLKSTLLSVLCQTGISMELIFADDGSTITYWDEIRDILAAHGFTAYKMSILETNSGVVQNYNHALKLAEGEFVKPISPGDMLFNPNVLHDWIQWLREKNCKISFGMAGYYHVRDDHTIALCSCRMPPQNIALYDGRHREELLIWYLLGEDTICGATMILEREIYARYMEIQAGKVIWLDDMILRLAVFEGEPILAYDPYVMWYEYGSGISTNGDPIWIERNWKDFAMSDIIIQYHMKPVDQISQRYQTYLNRRKENNMYNLALKLLLFRQTYLSFRLKLDRIQRRTDTSLNTDHLQALLTAGLH